MSGNTAQIIKKIQFWFSKPVVLLLTLLLLAATIFRFFKLGEVPHGMAWDEVAIGYNGYGIWQTRRDEWLARLPFSFRSFGDFKAPFAIYLNSFFTFLFGLNSFAVRLPFALSGVAAVVAIGAVLKSLLSEPYLKLEPKYVTWLSTLGLAMISFSPWHVHFSRTAFESGLSLTLLILGTWLMSDLLLQRTFFKALGIKYQLLQVAGAAVLLVCSMYSYHSAKIVVPLVMTSFVLCFWPLWKSRKIILFQVLVISTILLLPMIKDSFFGSGSERFLQSSVFGLNLDPVTTSIMLLERTVAHLNPDFLVGGVTTNLRHGDGMWGVLFPTEFVLGVASLVTILRAAFSSRVRKEPYMKLLIFFLAWVVIGFLPAIIGRDVPHSNRALLALPGWIGLSVLGFYICMSKLVSSGRVFFSSKNKVDSILIARVLVGTGVLLHSFFVLSYSHHYFTAFATASAADYQDGYLEAMEYAVAHEEEVDKVLITSVYGQPYIYTLFVRHTDPIWYRGGALIKYQFPDHINIGDLSSKKTLILATPDEIEPKLADKLIYGSDGKIRFVIVKTP